MKKELALRLLMETVPGLGDEGAVANLFRELQFLAEYKYNKYEMYDPGRLFLENLAVWLRQFEEGERRDALDFVRRQLIFVSRLEFQQLANGLYHDVIKWRQLRAAAVIGGYPAHKVRAIHESREFAEVAAGSLYVGMSDGARIDYIRRHNLEISNEQVLPYYDVSEAKVGRMLKDLCRRVGDATARFRCLFLIDDFCGSGRTLLREVVTTKLGDGSGPPIIPTQWQSRLRFDDATHELELQYEGAILPSGHLEMLAMGSGEDYANAINTLVYKAKARDTTLKGQLYNVANGVIRDALHEGAEIFFCPLLATEHAVKRLEPLAHRLSGQFSKLEILPGATIESSAEITSTATPIGALCEKHYSDEFGDQHTGCVKFGFDSCGLPLVLHHNTPNNSIYLLWARKSENFRPLFVRYERHGREGG